MDKNNTITVYDVGPIMGAFSIPPMLMELKQKIDRDRVILQENETKENKKAFLENQYSYYWLKNDYYDMRSLSANLEEEDARNGWFFWIKDYNFTPGRPIKTVDEKYTYWFEKYSDSLLRPLLAKNDYLDEAIWSYKNGKYHACACLLFTNIEYIEREIGEFDPSKRFVMSKELKGCHVPETHSFNKKYYLDFEAKMNAFLDKNYYAQSTASDPEPDVINRNRIMHGILTRKVSKTDCLKLFVLANSMLLFNDWLDCHREMRKISEELKTLSNE